MYNNLLFGDNVLELDEEDDSDVEDFEEGRGYVRWNILGILYSVDLKKVNIFFDWFKLIFFLMVRVVIGCDVMNLVFCFILVKFFLGLVGGVFIFLVLI